MRFRQGRMQCPAATDIDLGDVQGGILRGYRGEVRAHLSFEVDDACAARAWLAETAESVATAAAQAEGAQDAAFVNVAFTCAGLQALGVPQRRLADLPAPFREGMAARAQVLGDVGPNHPDTWDAPFGPGDRLHVVVLVDGSAAAVADRVADLRAELWQDGLIEICSPLLTERLPQGREHFGFVDGLSQPPLEGVPGTRSTSSPGQGRLRDGRWEPLAAGEFVLGLPDCDGLRDTTAPALTAGGSYLVLRKLAQDVPAFRRLVAETARLTECDDELAAARIMGRWRDGAPLTAASQAPDEPWGETDSHHEGFTYDGDDGSRCPVGAHVRRMNPRGSLGFSGRLEHRHRLLRRGMPYGPPYHDDDPASVDAERGLLFACYQTDLATQFEFVQSQWAGDGSALGLGDDRDPVAADSSGGSGHFWCDGASPRRVDVREPVVRVRGGAYLLMPGLRGLRHIVAAGDAAQAATRSLVGAGSAS